MGGVSAIIHLYADKLRAATSFVWTQYNLRKSFRKNNIYIFQNMNTESGNVIAGIFSFLIVNDTHYSGATFLVDHAQNKSQVVLDTNAPNYPRMDDVNVELLILHLLSYFNISPRSLRQNEVYKKSRLFYLFDIEPIEIQLECCKKSQPEGASCTHATVPSGRYQLRVVNATPSMLSYRKSTYQTGCDTDADIEVLIKKALDCR